jgi:GH25 family lysozyme M1 (1,4-beta-N-acetylmuramidase)
MTIQEFINQWQGQLVPSCGGITGQCVSLSQQWAQANGVSGCPVFPVAAAKDMAGSRPDFFDWTPNTPSGVPPAGAIIVFDSRYGGGYGHTGVCTGRADTNTFDMFQENDPGGSGAHVKTYNYNGCSGWLTFKSVTPPLADNEGIVQGQGLRAHTEPNTTSTYPWYYDDQEHITLLARTKGENVDGKWGYTDIWYQTDKGWVTDGYVQTKATPANVPDYVPPAAPPTPAPPTYSQNPAKGLWGIDVSAHQGDIDWSKKVVDFVIVKAGHTGVSYGGKQPANADPKYADNIKACGIPFGSYWYGYPSLDAKAEAQAFANTVDKSGSLWLDLEEQGDNIAQWALDFINETEKLTGRPCHLYTYFDYANNHPGLDHVFIGTNRQLWLAHYGIKPGDKLPATPLNKEPIMHQYSSTGLLAGITGNVDLNVYNGTDLSFNALAEPLHTEPIPTEPQTPPDPNAPTPTFWQLFIQFIKQLFGWA